jgi:hypothetical protein
MGFASEKANQSNRMSGFSWRKAIVLTVLDDNRMEAIVKEI